jgi:hypothetical protein
MYSISVQDPSPKGKKCIVQHPCPQEYVGEEGTASLSTTINRPHAKAVDNYFSALYLGWCWFIHMF